MVQRAYAVLFVAFMLAPLVVVVGASFEPRELLRFPPHGVSLHWYAMALESSEFVSAARTSLIVAVLATLGGLLLGVPSAYALARYDIPAKNLVSGVLNSPLLVPQLVIGVALLEILALLGIAASVFTLTLGHLLIALPYVVRTIHASLLGVHPSVEESASHPGPHRQLPAAGHREVGEAAASLGIDRLIALGEGGREIAEAAQAAGLTKSIGVATAEEAADLLEETQPGDLVLVKGSRAARTERVLEAFAKRQPEARVAS